MYRCVVCQHFQTSPLKPLGWLKPNFIWSLLGMGERKFVQMVQVTWPTCPPCLYMVKTIKNPLRNQKVNDLETCYAASSARVLPNLFKWWPWVDLDLFYGMVKCGPLCFCMGKRWNNGFFRNYCRLWFETSNRWFKWQKVSVDIKTLSPGGCMPTAPGLNACIKSWKKCIKSDFKKNSLKLATNGSNDKAFLMTSKFCPQGAVYHCRIY